jgi:ATP-dependent DNA ligase
MFRVDHPLRFIEPQLASPVDQPPDGKHWIHEIKHDGYRCQVLVERGNARVSSETAVIVHSELANRRVHA